MNFFDLLLPKRRKQKEVDRFFLHVLAKNNWCHSMYVFYRQQVSWQIILFCVST